MPTAFNDRRAAVLDGEDSIDRALVDRAREGDREAFAGLYLRHVASVYALALRTSGSKEVAEEVTSATFERALRSLPGFTWIGGGIRPWLLRITSVETSAWYRREQRPNTPRAQMVLRELATSGAPEPAAAFELEAPEVRDALTRLHPRYREAISLRFLSGLSADETAQAMGCSKTVLAVTLHRAVGALRRTLAVSVSKEIPS
jgi:RNA polymerase sigma-70 factor, ECF subfamily